MRRLTERDGKTGYAYFPKCFEGCDGYCGKCEHETNCVETLAAYEDTGHTPEQIREFDALYLAKCQEVNELRKRMRWIPANEWLPELEKIVLVHQTYSWERFEDGAQVTFGRLHISRKGQKPYWQFQHYRPDFKNGTIMDNDIICPGNEYVTAWMPLPEPYRPETTHNKPAWKQQMMNTFLGGKK